MQKLQLSIPEPCHENWQNMKPTEQGRYCNACAKEVVDFSMMTDTEVLNYFTSITYEKVCGRALPGQLERTISRPKEPKKRLFWYWNYIVMFFMFFSKANTVKAQGGVKKVTELNSIRPADSSNVLVGRTGGVAGDKLRSQAAAKPGNETTHRLGQTSVIGIGGGAIYVIDGTIMTSAQDINPDDVEEVSVLQASAAVAMYGADGKNGAIVVTMKKAKVKCLDTVTVKASSSNNYLRGRAGGLSVRTSITRYTEIKTRINTILTDSLKIYPNPVQRGDQMNVLLKLKQTGTHNIQIADVSGRIVLQKQIIAVAKDHIEKIPVDNRWGSGVYYIRVFENNNKLISTNSFIVK